MRSVLGSLQLLLLWCFIGINPGFRHCCALHPISTPSDQPPLGLNEQHTQRHQFDRQLKWPERRQIRQQLPIEEELFNPFLASDPGDGSWPPLPAPWDDADLTDLVRDNLLPDMAMWRGAKLSMDAFWHMNTHHRAWAQDPGDQAIRRLVMIRNGTVYFPRQPPAGRHTCGDEHSGVCDMQLASVFDALRSASRAFGIRLPDVAFWLNVGDHPICSADKSGLGQFQGAGPEEVCSVPVVSLNKNKGSSDLLGPVMWGLVSHQSNYPWGRKAEKAFFRGAGTCGTGLMPFGPRCARSKVARLHLSHPELFDAGFYTDVVGTDPELVAEDPLMREEPKLPILNQVPFRDQRKYKYLLSLDGVVAAYRLGNLMHTNSVILKQTSQWWEYYYRSLRRDVHYTEIFNTSADDVLDMVQWLKSHDAAAQQLAEASQRFGARYLGVRSRLLYWKYVCMAYAALIPDMGSYFDGSVPGPYQDWIRPPPPPADVPVV